MQTARRIYLYLVAFISLQVALAGARSVLRLLADLALVSSGSLLNRAQYARDQLSLWGALLVVGATVWAIHWLLIRRAIAADGARGEERRAIWRQLFIYVTLLVAAWQIFFAVGNLMRALLTSLAAPGGSGPGPDLADPLAALLIYGAAWLAHWAARRDDLAHAAQSGAGATVARWYTYLTSYGALSALLWALSEAARQLWRAGTVAGGAALLVDGDPAWSLANAVGFASAGLLVWLGHWSLAQRRMRHGASERRAVLRKVYLYATIGQTVGVTLANLALFLYTTLRALIGTAPLARGDSLLTAAGQPLLTAFVYGLFWAYHRRVLDGDAALLMEWGRQATVRRIYTYLVSSIGLALLAGGAADLLRLLLDLALGGRATIVLDGRGWGDQISRFATLVLVGGLVWSAHWLPAQRRAMAGSGATERRALTRRIALFLIIFVSVIALLASGAVLIYQLLRSLGLGLAAADRSALSWAIGVAVTAGIALIYHLRILIADQRPPAAGEDEAATPSRPVAPMTTRLVLLSAPAPADLDAALATLRGTLSPETTVAVFPADGLAASEVCAWVAGRARADPASPSHDSVPTGTVV